MNKDVSVRYSFSVNGPGSRETLKELKKIFEPYENTHIGHVYTSLGQAMPTGTDKNDMIGTVSIVRTTRGATPSSFFFVEVHAKNIRHENLMRAICKSKYEFQNVRIDVIGSERSGKRSVCETVYMPNSGWDDYDT